MNGVINVINIAILTICDVIAYFYGFWEYTLDPSILRQIFLKSIEKQ